MNECNIVRDLLPLYAEKLASVDSQIFVEGHLQSCEECRSKLEEMRLLNVQAMDAAPLRRVRRKLRVQMGWAIAATALVLLAAAVAAVGWLTAPEFLSSPEEMFEWIEYEDGSLKVVMRGCAAGCKWSMVAEDSVDSEAWGLCLSVWTTPMHRMLGLYLEESRLFLPEERPDAVYYDACDGGEMKLVYGRELFPDGGVIAQPRLAMNAYRLLAVAAWIVLLLPRALFRKKVKASGLLDGLLAAVTAWLLASLCISGMNAETYTLQRDLSLSILTAMPIGGVLWMIRGRMRKKQCAGDVDALRVP